MFRQLARHIGDANVILTLQPSQLAMLMDEAWNSRVNDVVDLGLPDNRTGTPSLLAHLLEMVHPEGGPAAVRAAGAAAAGAPQAGPAAAAAQAAQAALASRATLQAAQQAAAQTAAGFDAAVALASAAAAQSNAAAQGAVNGGLALPGDLWIANAGAMVNAANALAGAQTANNAVALANAAAAAALSAQNAAAVPGAPAQLQSAANSAADSAATAARQAALAAASASAAAGVPNANAALTGPAGTRAATAAAAAHLRWLGGRALLQRYRWDHLIYAYMIENTRVYDIFRRVLFELLHDERLGTPSTATQLWMRATEELFYRDPPPFSISTITSHIRPDMGSSRRNAYQRMFGMDLIHGTHDNNPYPYIRAHAANGQFVGTFEEFLREIWVAIVHQSTTSGPNPTDDAKIADLAEKLFDMLVTRRQNGNLSREEFVSVSMMSWFHLSVDSNLPVVVDLKAEASSPDERLFKIAQRVQLPAHALSKNYFDIAEDISTILIAIESGAFRTANAVPALYKPAPGNPFPDLMKTIIRHWSVISGRDLKAGRVATSVGEHMVGEGVRTQTQLRTRPVGQTNGAPSRL